MSVELDPVELGFRRPFSNEVSQVLRLHNPHSDPVAFKVKTTAPKQYCVRPNSGRIEPGRDVEVQVLLQAMKEDPPPDAKCRDKFLVQSVAVTADMEVNNIASIWSHIEQTDKKAIQEKKIRVVFLPPEGSTGTGFIGTPQKSVNGLSQGDGSSSHRSPSPEAVTPRYVSTAQPVGPVSTPEQRPAGNQHLGDAVNSAYNPATSGQSTGYSSGQQGGQSTIASVGSTIANAIPTSTDDLKAQLDSATSTISRMTQQIEEQTLRQRKSDTVNQDAKDRITTGTTGMGQQQQVASGVPVQIVAGLCLLCFLLAYFFF